MRTTLSALALVAILPGLSPAQQVQACASPLPTGYILAKGGTVTVPGNALKVYSWDGTTRSTAPVATVAGGQWTVSSDAFSALSNAFLAGKTQLVFAGTGDTSLCSTSFSVSGTADAPQQTPVLSSRNRSIKEREFASSVDCGTAGAEWERELGSTSGNRTSHFTELVFVDAVGTGGGGICYYNRDFGVVGDPIYVGVFTPNPETWSSAKFEPCSLQSASPNVLQSTDKFPVSNLQSGGAWKLQTFVFRKCYNTSVDVSAVGTGGTQKYPLSQYDRYRATIQAGILFSELHDAQLGLRANQADTTQKLIYDRGASERGPEYVATLQLYSILRYIPSLFGRGGGVYEGRDPLHDQSVFDRLGAVIGAGISSPAKRFVVGASFEVIYGVNVVWVQDYAKLNRLLDGVSTTTPFKGAVADIPLKETWVSRPTLGMSIDLRYLSLLFTGNR